MKKRNYLVVDGKTGEANLYRGFDKDFTPETLDHVVLLLVEGELEVWAVESPEQEAEDLLRYYWEQGYPLGAVKFLGGFTSFSPSAPPVPG